MVKVFRTVSLAAAVAAMLGGLFACGPRSEAEILTAARSKIAAGDHAAAVIELKQAIQIAPNNADSRFLLGTTFAAAGQSQPAEVELRKAKELGFPVEKLATSYARALLENRQYKRLIDEASTLRVTDANDARTLKMLLAAAHAQTNDIARSDALARDVLAEAPGHAPALVLLARNQLRAGNADAALQAAESVLASDPEDVDALQIKGEVETYFNGRRAEGKKVFERILAKQPTHLDANLGLVSILLAESNFDAAQQRADQLAKLKPNAPHTRFMLAQVALAKRQLDRARSHAQSLLQAAPDSADFLQLAGSIEFEAGSLVKAEANLNKAMGIAPAKPQPRLLLARIYILTERQPMALAVLAPLLAQNATNIDAMLLAASVHQQLGDIASADELFARVGKVAPMDARLRTAMALSKIAKGQTEPGFNELQQLSDTQADGLADLTLFTAYLARNDLAGAARAVDALERKLPDQPIAANLRGRIAIFRRDVADATKQFQRALAIDKGYFPAANSLASLYILDGKPDLALGLFGDVLKVHPRQVQAALAIAGIKARTGAGKNEVVQLINEAIAMNPSDPSPRVQLIDYLTDLRDLKGAYAAAQAALTAVPNDVNLLERMARVQLDSGESNQAVASYGKLVSLRPSASAFMGLAGAQIAANNADGAVQTYRRLIDVAGNRPDVPRTVVAAMIKAGQRDAAMVLSRELQRKRPGDAIGALLAGDIDASRGRWADALAHFRQGLGKLGAEQIPLRMHATLLLAKQDGEAAKLAADWVRTNPHDVDFQLYLADLAFGRRDIAAAERLYAGVLSQDPAQPRALNNLAWLLLQSNKPGALALAEKAVAKLPADTAVLNTYAVALSNAGQLPKAIEVLVALAAAKPDNLQVQVNLAAAYIKAGDKPRAAALLKSVQARGSAFRNQNEVARLLKQV